MKAIHSMIAAFGLAFVLPAPADAAVGDPEVIIYRFPGVRDDGGGLHVGIATVFHCTNFSGVPENIRFATRNTTNSLVSNAIFPIAHLATITIVTHFVLSFTGIGTVAQGVSIDSGTTAIAATSTNIICTAMIVDAANPKPDGVALRGIRFSPIAGSQE